MNYNRQAIEKLLLNGGLKKIGCDEDGEDIYIITNVCKVVDPGLFRFREDFLGGVTLELIDLGLADLFVEDGELKMYLTPEAYDDTIVNSMSPGWRATVTQIKCMMEDECPDKV